MTARVRDIPFVARHSTHGRLGARHALGLASDLPVVLASFGGHDLQLPYQAVTTSGRFVLMLTTFEADAAGLDPRASGPHLRYVSQRELADRRLRYEDLVAAADVVVSKPGYGIVSECIANGAALLYTSRGRMVEYDVFVKEMPRLLRCRYIPREELLAGDWTAAVEALLSQPSAPTVPMTNGADVAATFILRAANA